MDVLISKQAAIDAIEKEKSLVERPITETRWFDLGLRKAQDVLSELPPAQSEQKTAEWIKIDKYDKESNVQCSACLEEFDYIDGVCYLCHGYELPLFCPSCGAKMDGGKAEYGETYWREDNE